MAGKGFDLPVGYTLLYAPRDSGEVDVIHRFCAPPSAGRPDIPTRTVAACPTRLLNRDRRERPDRTDSHHNNSKERKS